MEGARGCWSEQPVCRLQLRDFGEIVVAMMGVVGIDGTRRWYGLTVVVGFVSKLVAGKVKPSGCQRSQWK